MICAACGEATDTSPCAACGGEPLLDGRYKLIEVLGRGAHGTTWKAEHDGIIVALKEMVLRKEDAEKTRQLQEREARVLKELDHPQIPGFVDAFQTGTGRNRTLGTITRTK